ncbi:EAL domain-containing protein [Pseudomonas putida]|uniref:EAL domain-containing protein n=1 Tax=Pseudomonas putida TaxID=303 RepID=UPI003839DB74
MTDSDVERALGCGEIQPFFQPKFNLLSNELEGFEVLARWLHPRRGILPPLLFMPALERGGLLNELLLSQLLCGLALQKKLRARGEMLSFSYNLEVGQLATPELISTLKPLLASECDLAPWITFEVTERGVLELSDCAQRTLGELVGLGIRLSLDDFGTGFSSLERLYHFPFDELKLDARFISGVIDDERCQAIIKNTIYLAHALKMSVVLEGIENERQRQRLIELGGTRGQGYLYAGAMSADDVFAWSDIQQHVP